MAPRPKPKNNSTASSGGKGMKQGSLFSFFSKKKTPNSNASAAPSAPTISQSQASPKVAPPVAAAPPLSPAKQALLDQLQVGSRVEVFWPEDKKWYSASVKKQRDKPGPYSFHLEYDIDGQCEWIDLASEPFRFTTKKKKRIIDSDDDEEAEFEMPGSDDESEYNNAVEDDDDDDSQLSMVMTDDDDDEVVVKKKPAKKRKITNAGGSSSNNSLGQFANSAKKVVTVTVHPSSSAARKTPTGRPTAKNITPATVMSNFSQPSPKAVFAVAAATSTKQEENGPPKYVVGIVNQAGSHVHNHLPFLQHPKDSAGRSPNHAQYDGRTLQVIHSDWYKETGKKMTDAVKQWWDLKSQYFDTVLLFKTGKFYEMFHMDADIGFQVCGLIYMKGHIAHSGFPEIAYGTNADKLVRAGYKVARVEQTETPDQLKERKKKCARGSAPKVVNREVCSILTAGTRTFCFLDEPTGEFVDKASADSSIGPLLAIREIMLEDSSMSASDDDQVQPLCEYGITLVDAVRGSVTVGQFADDVLRSRMVTLLTAFCPSEILLEGGENGTSPTLVSLINSLQKSSQQAYRVETIQPTESFPQSTALDPRIRKHLERGGRLGKVQPWDVQETLAELHRRKYYPRASKKQEDQTSVKRWPKVLRAAVEGEAELALSSLGAALYYLQRNLIDMELLSMGIVKAYIPPETSATANHQPPGEIGQLAEKQTLQEAGLGDSDESKSRATPMLIDRECLSAESQISHMSLDGTTLHNLEILTNSVNHKVSGSLWSKINFTKTPHGARLLRAWLLRPLFRKEDIERRVDAVEELVSGSAAVALSEARASLSKCGDIERLLSRVHSMSGCGLSGADEGDERIHPSDRAVLYENASYTKRKVGDFSKVLNGLRAASQIPELFHGVEITSGLLRKIVHFSENGGCFPDIAEDLEWFFSNFDCNAAAKGRFEPSQGIDDLYDEACDSIESTIAELMNYKEEMCSDVLTPRALAKSKWTYANTKIESKDKYLIELPVDVAVPDDFIMKGKRGSGHKQVNKYRSSVVEQLVQDLERAYKVQKERKARGMELIFAKFDSKRTLWAAAAQATALLDALGSLAQTAAKSGYTRPRILTCSPNESPRIKVEQGRHPCVEHTYGSTEFIPNDLSLGCTTGEGGTTPRVLLLSGPNMGGKSTLLRQTCLIAILAQIGSFVPCAECEITPVDRIFTRLGASDRILLNQSTFFVELAECSAAMRGSTRRSLVIMDELGRGTSTFDGTAIASAAVQHLVEQSQCLSLFATHYHSLLDEWKEDTKVQLGHMECLVERSDDDAESEERNITFLYTLGEGVCPKSFGINVARLAGLPDDVLEKAKRISAEFEKEMNSAEGCPSDMNFQTMEEEHQTCVAAACENEDWEEISKLWQSLGA